jgi:hypothetical protein
MMVVVGLEMVPGIVKAKGCDGVFVCRRRKKGEVMGREK